MRKFTKITFKLLDLLVIFMMVFGSAMPVLAAPSPTGATIASDLADYAPGATVTLTGAGWAAGESVDITVNDDAGQTWSLNSNPDPAADSSGAFTYQFQLPNWFVANYGVTAIGTTSGTATTTFTDASLITVHAALPSTYTRVAPPPLGTQTCPSGGRLSNPLPNAAFATGVTSLNPQQVALGQILAFEYNITAPSGGFGGNIVNFQASYSTVTTNGQTFGFDPAFGVYCAFVDSSDPTAALDTDASASVTSSSLVGTDIVGQIHVTGVDPNESVVVEVWVVLDKTIPAQLTGNVQTSLDNASDGSGNAIQTGNQTVPLKQVGDFASQPAHIIVKKLTNPSGDPALFPFTLTGGGSNINQSFSLSDGQTHDSGPITSSVGFNAAELVPSGWDLTSASCDNGTGTLSGGTISNISVAAGETTTCTFNDRKRGTIIVEKQTNPDGAAGNFTFTGDAAGTISDNGQIVVSNLVPGTYTSTESNPSPDFNLTSIACDDGSSLTPSTVNLGTRTATFKLDPGETVKCTFTNTMQQGSLTVIKHVINDNGGAATADQWSIHVKSGTNEVSGSPQAGSESGTSYTLTNGSYNVSETGGPSGYTFTGFSGDCDSSGNVTVVAGQTKTCTLTNNDNAASLILVKHVVNNNGGTAVASAWTLSAGSHSVTGSETGAEATNQAGTYNLSESSVAGYSLTSLTCDNSTGQVSSVTVGLGETVTCTFVNDDNVSALYLVKHVINDNGGSATAPAWTLSAGSHSVTGSEAGALATNQAGTYALSESSVAGYTNTSITCDNSTGQVTSVTVGLGETVTCTFVNDDNASALYLVKHVINNNGGTATASDWTLFAGSHSVTGSEAGALATNQAGTYSLTEGGPGNYANTSITCDNSTGQVTSVTVGLGQTVTCTFVNDDKAASLILVKHVVNNNGGTALASAWTLSAGSHSVTGSETGAEATNQAGTYNLSETGPSGYTQTSLTCDNSTGQVTSVTVALGQTVTCTFVNDDNPASLKLIKHVVNNNGGTAVASAWTLSAGSNSVTGSETGAVATNQAGTYALSETSVSGYSQTSLTCDNSSGQVTSVTVGLGQTVTCTFVNDDNAPALYLVKHVINNNGGTAVASAWTLSAGSHSVTGSETGALATNQAGTYNLSESSVTGYTNTSITCNNNAGVQVTSVTLGLGQNITCTFVNDDIAPSLTLNKVVINNNGGTAAESAWTLTANGGTAGTLSGPGAAGNADVVSGSTFKAGTYALSESGGPSGYTASAWSCVKNGGSAVTGSSIALGIGDSATCTITNDDQPGTIIIIKSAKPAQGSFAFTTTGTGYNGFTLTGSTASNGNVNSQTLNVGTYTVKESTQLSWILTGIGGSTDPNNPYNCVVTGSGGSTGVGNLNTQTATINLKNGDTVTCTFENTGLGATRTQGFWATHPQLAQIAWFGGSAYGHTFPGVVNVSGIGNTTLCGRPIDTLGKLMGGFWSDVSKKSNGAKRTALDQSRMQLLQQLLAAELNASAFGSTPISGSFTAWESAYCGTNTSAIQTAQQQAGSFNSQGDNTTFTPGTSADSKTARAIANYAWWDNLP